MTLTTLRMTGAASRTTGVMIAHEIIHDINQWLRKFDPLKNGALEIAAATAQVSPD
jgi:hypothetical protein